VRLCRLWRDQGKPGEVSRPLRAIYKTFTEGFATADLREARDVLESR
jgi:predicted ATPase